MLLLLHVAVAETKMRLHDTNIITFIRSYAYQRKHHKREEGRLNHTHFHSTSYMTMYYREQRLNHRGTYLRLIIIKNLSSTRKIY